MEFNNNKIEFLLNKEKYVINRHITFFFLEGQRNSVENNTYY